MNKYITYIRISVFAIFVIIYTFNITLYAKLVEEIATAVVTDFDVVNVGYGNNSPVIVGGDGKTEETAFRLYKTTKLLLQIKNIQSENSTNGAKLCIDYNGKTIGSNETIEIETDNLEVGMIYTLDITAYYMNSEEKGQSHTERVYYTIIEKPIFVLKSNLDNQSYELQKGESVTLNIDFSTTVTNGGESANYIFYTKKPSGDIEEAKKTTNNHKVTLLYTGLYEFYVQLTDKFGNIWVSNHILVYSYEEYNITVEDTKNWGTIYLHYWGINSSGTSFPGIPIEPISTSDGKWYNVKIRNSWTGFVLCNGKISDNEQTIDYNPTIFTGQQGSCYIMEENTDGKVELKPTEHCIVVRNLNNNYIGVVGMPITVLPEISYYNMPDLEYRWTILQNENVAGATSKSERSITLSPIAEGTISLLLTIISKSSSAELYTSSDIKVTFTNETNGIIIRVHIADDLLTTNPTDNMPWKEVKMHYWREDLNDDIYKGCNAESGLIIDEGNNWYRFVLPEDIKNFNFMLYSGELDENDNYNYSKSIDIEDVEESGCYELKSDLWSSSDKNNLKRMLHNVEQSGYDCGLFYRVKSESDNGTFYSNRVMRQGELLSYYANKTGNLTLQRYDDTDWQNRHWTDLSIIENPVESNVQTAIFDGNGIREQKVYFGEYLLFSPAVEVGHKHAVQKDSLFTKFSGNAEYTSNPYNYYWVDWIAGNQNPVAGSVGNRINTCLAQYIDKDDLFPDAQTSDVGANIRFAYNPETNYFTRTALTGSTNKTDRFLMLYDTDGKTLFKRIYDQNGNIVDITDNKYNYDAITSSNDEGYFRNAVFDCVSDWVYQLDIMANGNSKVELIAMFNNSEQYLFGEKKLNLINNKIEEQLTIRIIYDFKTNRLISAWIPENEINNSIELGASMMLVRNGNNVQQIDLTNNIDVTGIDQIYTLLEMEKEEGEESNKNDIDTYFFSLPYNCNVSDIFGLEGEYLEHWALLRYDGVSRAEKGLFADNGSFWTLVGKDEELQKGVGYLLQVSDLDWTKTMERNGKRIAINRLYFPSIETNLQLSNREETTEVESHPYIGPIHSTNNIDHTKSDCDWNFVGIPTYTDVKAAFNPRHSLETDAMTFYYEWNGTDWIAKNTDDVTFHATFAYMFQWAGTINWEKSTGAIVAKTIKREQQETESALLELQLLRENIVQDVVYVQMFDNATLGFDIGYDLTKIIKTGDNLYTRCYENNLYVDLAANNLPFSVEQVPLLLTTSTDADYTFHKSKCDNDIVVSIYDTTNDHLVNLDFSDYTVRLTKGEHNNRFRLYLKHKQNETATSLIDNNHNWQISQADHRIFIGGLTEPTTVALYDLTGKLLENTILNSGESIAAPCNNGIYVLIIGNQALKISVK